MKPGTRVKMSEQFKQLLTQNEAAEHVKEFGHCIGVVEGLTDYGTQQGPEVDVRWFPSNLRYAYLPDNLDEVC